MALAPSSSTFNVPRWLLWVGSALISFHLLALGVRVLAADSGPWPVGDEDMPEAPPPQFAYQAYKSLPGDYVKLLQLTNHYHFATDRTAHLGVYLEARLKDGEGNEIARVKYPQDDASFWLKHRQGLLVQKLTMDELVAVPTTERVAAPNRAVEMVTLWEEYENRKMRLKTVDRNSLIGSMRRPEQPSDLCMLYVKAYARYLCREHGAAKVEILRHHQEPIPPGALFDDNIPAGAFDEVISNFGEFPR
jgi:hypothetical protein